MEDRDVPMPWQGIGTVHADLGCRAASGWDVTERDRNIGQEEFALRIVRNDAATQIVDTLDSLDLPRFEPGGKRAIGCHWAIFC